MAKDKSLRISITNFLASRSSANKLTESGCLYYNVLVINSESVSFIKWQLLVDVPMPNPDMLQLFLVFQRVRDFDLEKTHSTIMCEGTVVFYQWRHKTFRFRDMIKEGCRVWSRMTGNEAMEPFRDV